MYDSQKSQMTYKERKSGEPREEIREVVCSIAKDAGEMLSWGGRGRRGGGEGTEFLALVGGILRGGTRSTCARAFAIAIAFDILFPTGTSDPSTSLSLSISISRSIVTRTSGATTDVPL